MKTKWEKELDKKCKREQEMRDIEEAFARLRAFHREQDDWRPPPVQMEAGTPKIEPLSEAELDDLRRSERLRKIDAQIGQWFPWYAILCVVTCICWVLGEANPEESLFHLLWRSWNYLVGLLMLVSLAFGLGRLSPK